MTVQNDIELIEARSLSILSQLKTFAEEERGEKRAPIFSINQVANLVSRSASTIRDAENDGRLPEMPRGENGRRLPYTLSQVNTLRAHFGTERRRAPSDPVSIVAVQNFKGGVAKSTTACHLAQYLTMQGLRVLLVDCDSQATSTMFFGYIPDRDLGVEETLYPFFHDLTMPSLRYAVRKTHWENLDLIPANLHLYQAEYEIAAVLGTARTQGQGAVAAVMSRLRLGLETVSDDYDVIILDPPPALGQISLSVFRAASALIIPVPPSVPDFSSTSSFLSLMLETFEILEQIGAPIMLDWIRMLVTKINPGLPGQVAIADVIRQTYGPLVLNADFKESAAITNAGGQMQTVYEMDVPASNRKSYQRCLDSLNAVCSEIEIEIRRTWPSQADWLLSSGKI